MKILHISLAVIILLSFVIRVILSQLHPEWLKQKSIKTLPHLLDTLLLISGLILLAQGHWLYKRYDWILAKFAGLFAYIAFGALAIKQHGLVKWLSFTAALGCLVYIGSVAVSKQSWPF